MSQEKGIGALVVLIVIAGGIWWFVTRDAVPADRPAQEREDRSYENETYGYAFAYPADMRVQEYTPQAVAIGTSTAQGGFDATVAVEVAEGSAQEGNATFYDFLLERGRNLCAADGPNESVDCGTIVRNDDFTAATGLAGQALYFELIRKNISAGTASTSAFGPVYAFSIAADATNSPYAALLIYQPLAGYLENKRADAVTQVARSLTIDEIKERP